MVTAETHVLNVCSCEKSISRKNPVLTINMFSPLVLPRNVIILQHLIIQFTLYYFQAATSGSILSSISFLGCLLGSSHFASEYRLKSNRTYMACKVSKDGNLSDNHMSVITPYHARMTSHLKRSAVLDFTNFF